MTDPHHTNLNMLARRRMIARAMRQLGMMLAGGAAWSQCASFAADKVVPAPKYAPVNPGYDLIFPRDHGAHPDFRTEWWYLTAWLDTQSGPAGLQLTFFRSRTAHARRNPSRLAARQLLFGHAALAWPDHGRLLTEELAARALPGMVSEQDTQIRMGSATRAWSMVRLADDHYKIELRSESFDISARLSPPSAPVLQGQAGLSRKGPQPQQASYYYSRPQLALTGVLRAPALKSSAVTGLGWLDHEWSSELLDESATGWDWVGLNLNNGDALMAFRIRRSDGSTMWSHARWIRQHQPREVAAPQFTPKRYWRSGRTGTRYPVQMDLQVGDVKLQLLPLLDDQELDSRQTTGILYWEGAVKVVASNGTHAGKQIGRGYLELTGYAGKVPL